MDSLRASVRVVYVCMCCMCNQVGGQVSGLRSVGTEGADMRVLKHVWARCIPDEAGEEFFLGDGRWRNSDVQQATCVSRDLLESFCLFEERVGRIE